MQYTFYTLLIISVLLLCKAQCQDTSLFSGQKFEEEYIVQLLHKVNDYQQIHTGWTDDRNWERATYYTGVMAFYNVTRDEKILDQAMTWAESHHWKVGNELMFPANRFTCVQTYLEIFFHTNDTTQIKKSKAYMDSEIIQTEPAYLRGWYYIDALYVGPPAFVMMSKATGENKYNNYINPMFWEIADQLYDEDAGLFYRDSKARFNEKSKNGKKVLWSRGNGWVMAALPRIMMYLPEDDPYYKKYQDLLISMAAMLKKRQGEDGFWRVNLNDPDEFPMPESSGTAFFTYAIAWGLNNGILDPTIYTPVIQKAWKGLCNVVDEEGKV
ncbi:MAG: glycoside hydrolase family 88 protein, partial [Bacteroidales bacterium]|nr:glycoside hydrolase family 88 protein [Bacteroidales bacterium]